MAEKKLHAIMISFPFQGHVTPFINLALKLASNGCTITFVHTEFIHHMLSKAQQNTGVEEHANFFTGPHKSGLDIRYMTIYDGFPVEYDRNLNFHEYWESILRDFSSRVDELIGEIVQAGDASFTPILVADTLYSWPATIAEKYNMVNVSFWTEPALVFAIDYHLDLLRENGNFPDGESGRKKNSASGPCMHFVTSLTKGFQNNKEYEIDCIPGVDSISSKDLMSYLHEADTSIIHRIVLKAFEQVKLADFILINTVYELEQRTLFALNQKQPTFAVGPINFSGDFTKTVVPKSLWSEAECTEWLNTKPPGSVLYVSFGSIAQSNKELTEEIAHGLLISGVNFIWVLRPGTDDLPDGFKNKTKDSGLIVSWCNQIEVISNPAVGGFITHCGWNSILESIWCGVPMICFPFYVDQPTNTKLVVDDWKIGINLRDGMTVDREEIAEKIKRAMSAETSNSMRREIKNLQITFRNALSEGGSTTKNFDRFLKDLRAKVNST